MRNTSRFFAQFSLRDLVGINSSGQAAPQRRGFGGIGGGSGYGGPGPRSHHKSESFSRPLSMPGDETFDEAEFIAALKKEVQSQITASESILTFEGEIEGDFNSSEFFFEYVQGDIKGRIIVSGVVIGNTYRLRAQLEERAE